MRSTNSGSELVFVARVEQVSGVPSMGKASKRDISRAMRMATFRLGRKLSSRNCWGKGVVRRVSFVEESWIFWRAAAFSEGFDEDSYWVMASWIVVEREVRAGSGGLNGGRPPNPGGGPPDGVPDMDAG